VNILYFTIPYQDYLSDSILIGLKRQFGRQVDDFPVNRFIYRDCEEVFEERKMNLYGRGFTLYNLLDPSMKPSNQFVQLNEAGFKKYDLVIFSSIWRQTGIFLQYQKWLDPQKVILIDGEDSNEIVPFHSSFVRNKQFFILPKLNKRYTYFKRELVTKERLRYMKSWIGKIFTPLNKEYENIQPISFSIPKEKIVEDLPVKEKEFPLHIVDGEILQNLGRGQKKYAFSNEHEYYKDIGKSKFGITSKKAGWDCMRHYEIAASGSVICFKNLEDKPTGCAPHGLVDMTNCISYRNYQDLRRKIELLTEETYKEVLNNSLTWVKQHSCERVAANLMNYVQSRKEELN